MRLTTLGDLPARIATGGFILHTGIQKWSADEQTAQGVHGMAAGAFPFLNAIPPERFIKLLSIAEIGTGAALLAPFVPSAVAALFADAPASSGADVGNLLNVGLIEAEDVSNAIVWLVSDQARYVTGIALPVDAGFTAS